MNGERVLVIGGGVIGLASAYYLQRAGYQVTVVDRGELGAECSHGNCGLVCPSHVLPLAEPGAIRSALKALITPGAAFRIRPRMDLALWRWLASFAKRCNRRDMIASGHAIHPLLRSSLSLYRELVDEEGIECEWQRQGLLFAYRSHAAFESYRPVNDLLTEVFGEPAESMDGRALVEFEPTLRQGLAGGWFFEHDAHLRPDRLIASWVKLLQARGARLLTHTELREFSRQGNRVLSANVGEESVEADHFVVATGARTAKLAGVLGIQLPIQPGKGYSITLARPQECPRVPIIFPEHRVVATPMRTGLRLGSIMEFAGYDESIPLDRLRLLTHGASHYFRSPIPDVFPEQWYGWRPMTYDSTPIVGRCPGLSNVYFATGHNMLGLSMAPATGRLVTELIGNVEPHIPVEPYAPARFV